MSVNAILTHGDLHVAPERRGYTPLWAITRHTLGLAAPSCCGLK
jgi:hypothetical protein